MTTPKVTREELVQELRDVRAELTEYHHRKALWSIDELLARLDAEERDGKGEAK